MKSRTRSGIYLSVATIILTMAVAVPAAAQTSCPSVAPGCFKGTFQGEDAHGLVPPGATTIAIDTTGTGTGTHLGQFSLIRQVIGNLTNLSDTGSARWIAANQDSIYTTISGQAELSDEGGGSLKVTEVHIITGGTGRFAGAQGSFTVVLFHRLAPSSVVGNVEAHDISGSFHGTIAFADAHR